MGTPKREENSDVKFKASYRWDYCSLCGAEQTPGVPAITMRIEKALYRHEQRPYNDDDPPEGIDDIEIAICRQCLIAMSAEILNTAEGHGKDGKTGDFISRVAEQAKGMPEWKKQGGFHTFYHDRQSRPKAEGEDNG